MVFKKSIYILLLSCFGIAAANAVTLELEGSNDNILGYGDRANDTTIFGGALPRGCSFPGQCIEEDGFYIGTASSDSPISAINVGAHLHRTANVNTGTKGIEYENDSVGMVIKAVDSSNFNFDSLNLDLHQAIENSYDADFIISSHEINTDGSKGALIGAIGVPNFSQNGVLDLSTNSLFQDVGMIYMYFDGYMIGETNGTGIPVLFNARIDDINVSAVPVPAAVYLFATGLAGLISLRRKNLSITV